MEGNTEVLVQLAEIRGQLSTFIGLTGRLDSDQSKLEALVAANYAMQEAKITALDLRLTASEATKRAIPSWWVWVPAVCTILALAFVLFDRVQKGS
jgi:hypothetical protein